MININIAIDNTGKTAEQIGDELAGKLTEAVAKTINENGFTALDAVQLASSLALGASGMMALAITPEFSADVLRRLADIVVAPESKRQLGFPLVN